MEESELIVPFKKITGCYIEDGKSEEMETSVEATDMDQEKCGGGDGEYYDT